MRYNQSMNPQFYGAAADYNKPKQGKLLNKKVLLIAGAALLGLVIISVIFAILGSIGAGPRSDIARLIVREQQLQDIITKNQALVGNTDLAKVSSEANLFLTSDITALTDIFGDKIPEDITASETDASIATKLKAATQSGKFDEVYLQTITSQVNSSLTLAQKIKLQTSGQQTRAAAAQAGTNLGAIADRLEAIKL